MPDLPKAAPPDWEQDDFIEELLDASGARLRHGGDRAYFSPREDVIQMPFAKDFTSKAAYYSTMLHEWYHWTGHSSRDNREFGTSFGDELYALEEIRAESLSVMAGMALGLPVAIDNHAAYLQSWAKKLETKEGVKEIIKGMNDAGKMLDVILTFKNGAEPVIDWWPDKMVEETESESGFSLV
jgi:putative DNA primase/helicase